MPEVPENIKDAGRGKRKMRRCFLAAPPLCESCLSCLRRRSCCSLCVCQAPCHPAIVQARNQHRLPLFSAPDLQLQAALPNIAALCHVCKIQCHPSAMIRGRHGFGGLYCLRVAPRGSQNSLSFFTLASFTPVLFGLLGWQCGESLTRG